VRELFLRGSSVLGISGEIEAEIRQEFSLNPHALQKTKTQSMRHPRGFQVCLD
jgi:hypothetical protein